METFCNEVQQGDLLTNADGILLKFIKFGHCEWTDICGGCKGRIDAKDLKTGHNISKCYGTKISSVYGTQCLIDICERWIDEVDFLL